VGKHDYPERVIRGGSAGTDLVGAFIRSGGDREEQSLTSVRPKKVLIQH